MKFIQPKIVGFFRKNIEIFLLIFLLIISVFITQFYNSNVKKIQNDYLEVLRNSYFKKSVSYFFSNLKPKFEDIEYQIKPGDSLLKILNNFSINDQEIKRVTEIFNKNNINKIRQNQVINLTLVNTGKDKEILNILIPLSPTKKLEIYKNTKNNSFAKREIVTNLKKIIVLKEGTIKSSLYKSATKEDISPNIIVEFARIYGFQIDFQRDIRKNDSFQIVYEEYKNEENKTVDFGNILYANLIIQGKSYELYHFSSESEKINDHFESNGQSIKKTLMKTPINGARLSSSFGMRKHPILGYNKMHRGTDFAAPSGTPIMASGSGTITRARWCGGGGNCVKIRHNSTYETIYAHMKSFAKGIKEGRKVKQGQIIGYVGSTGMSTGPHLHYEVVVNGKKVNSQRLKLPSGKKLKGEARKDFELKRIKIDLKLSELR